MWELEEDIRIVRDDLPDAVAAELDLCGNKLRIRLLNYALKNQVL